MPTEPEMIQQLAEAHQRGVHDVDASLFATLSRDAAYRIQAGVMSALRTTPAMLKTGVHSDGVGVVAPIFLLGQSGAFRMSSANVIGLELEVGVVLGSDITPEAAGADEIGIVEAIDHYFVGVEICGSRFVDRALAGLNGGLSDNMSALAYCINPTRRDAGADVDGFDVMLSFAGAEIYRAPAKHGFGTVLASVIAYAKNQVPAYPLRAGTIITTGSLCGLVPIIGTGHVIGRLGNHTVEFDIV
jgi:2-keto-4-pentenoate hydratase